MPRLLLFALFILASSVGRAQNLLDYKESAIISYMNDKGVFFEGKKYAKDGEPMLLYSYSTNSALQNGLVACYYFLNDSGVCTQVVMFYVKQSFLDPIVAKLKSDANLEKIPDEFAWVNKAGGYVIEIDPSTENESFAIRYLSIKDQILARPNKK